MKGSKIARVLSFHLAEYPVVVAKILQRLFTVILCALAVCVDVNPRCACQCLFGTRSRMMWVASVDHTAPGNPASEYSAMC